MWIYSRFYSPHSSGLSHIEACGTGHIMLDGWTRKINVSCVFGEQIISVQSSVDMTRV